MATRLERKDPVGMGELMKLYIRSMGIAPQLNTHRIFNAWDEVSGASKYTTNRFFKDGVLHISLSSSVVRSRLSFQKDILAKKMNELLKKDELFSPDVKGASFVKELILK